MPSARATAPYELPAASARQACTRSNASSSRRSAESACSATSGSEARTACSSSSLSRSGRSAISVGGPAEVHGHGRTGERGAARAGQERDHVRHLSRLDQPLDGVRLENDALQRLLLADSVAAPPGGGLPLHPPRAHGA